MPKIPESEPAAFTKLARLLRMHRQNVFNIVSGDAHHRAILRLQRTSAYRAMVERNRAEENIRNGERLARMGY